MVIIRSYQLGEAGTQTVASATRNRNHSYLGLRRNSNTQSGHSFRAKQQSRLAWIRKWSTMGRLLLLRRKRAEPGWHF